MANTDSSAGVLSVISVTIAAGSAALQALWKSRDDQEKERREREQKQTDEERARRQKEADEEAAAISARLHRLEERMGSQDVTNARQDEAIRSIGTSLAGLDKKMDRLDEKFDRLLSERPGSSPGGGRR